MATDGSGRQIPSIARIFVRPIGSGLPLGFFAFGLGMFMLGALGSRTSRRATSRTRA